MAIEQLTQIEGTKGQVETALNILSMLHEKNGYLLMHDFEAQSEDRSRYDISSILEVLPEKAAEEVWAGIEKRDLKIKGIDKRPKEKKPWQKWVTNENGEFLDIPMENKEISLLIQESKVTQKGLLTQREEINLMIKRAKGLRGHNKKMVYEAEHELALRNLRLIYSVAKKYHGYGLDLGDSFQEGYFGFIRGLRKFDWRLGYKLSTYTTWWTRQAVTRSLDNFDLHPAHFRDQMSKLNKATAFLEQELGREKPTNEELAKIMDTTPEKVGNIKKHIKLIESLDDQIGENEETTLGEIIADDTLSPEEIYLEEEERQRASELVEELLSILTLQERMVLTKMHLNRAKSLTDADTARAFDLTRERIRQVKNEARVRMTNYLQEHKKIDPDKILKYIYGEGDS